MTGAESLRVRHSAQTRDVAARCPDMAVIIVHNIELKRNLVACWQERLHIGKGGYSFVSISIWGIFTLTGPLK